LVIENFLSDKLCNKLNLDLDTLRKDNNNIFTVADIGSDGSTNRVQDESSTPNQIQNVDSSYRRGETCTIGRQCEKNLPSSDARDNLYDIVDELREDLDDYFYDEDDDESEKLDPDLIEMMYAYYPKGGYYRRHRDAEKGSVSDIRKYSFLLFLNSDWKPDDGGRLRIHCDGYLEGDVLPPDILPNYREIEPKAGTLVIFRSDAIPHEVLDTHAQRRGIVGWFLGENSTGSAADEVTTKKKTMINGMDVATLDALRILRDSVPQIKHKLQPSKQQESGMFGMFFGDEEVKQQDEEKEDEIDDTTSKYWSKVCAFDENGLLTTLSLGGQRMHRICPEVVLKPQFFTLNNLQLGSTDLPISILSQWVASSANNLKTLHLGGNALGNQGVTTLLQMYLDASSSEPLPLRCLDLRYNNISGEGAKAIADVLLSSPQFRFLETLFLEGNDLGDDGAKALSIENSTITELFLGQNKIGSDGAAALAQGLKHGRLKKLYMEGNCIGPDGARAFTSALNELNESNSKKLEKLFVDNNDIGKDEAMALGTALDSATMINDGGLFQQ